MKANILFIAIAAVAMLMQSCTLMYVPNAQNVPLMKEKNEVRATVGFSNATFAYAPTENVGLMLNAQYKTSHLAKVAGERDSRKLLLEAGGGIFSPYGNDGVMEVYGGLGAGRIYFHDPADDSTGSRSYEVNTARFFLQPGIGVSREHVDFAFSMRMVALQFFNARTNYTDEELEDEGMYGVERNFYSFIEPCFTLRFGRRSVKMETQFMLSLNRSLTTINHNPFHFHIGAHINIADRYK